jgi:hypothetical protein
MFNSKAFRLVNPLVLALSVFMVVSAPISLHAQIVAGRITALNGSSSITRAAKKFGATYGASVDVGDQLETSASGRLTVTLTDNSQLELAESSTMLISEDVVNPNGTRAHTSFALLGGLVRSLVKVAAGTSPNFEVHTPNAVASARGTTYDTYYSDHENRRGFKACKQFTDVLDYDGVVGVESVTNPTSPKVELHSGQKTTVPCGLALLPATALSALSTSGGTGAAAGGALGGLSAATVAGASLGSAAIISGAAVGGVAASGGFSGGSSSSGLAAVQPSPTPTVAPMTPTM